MKVPYATKYNRIEFCAAWRFNYGGTANNAWRVWEVERLENEKRELWAKKNCSANLPI